MKRMVAVFSLAAMGMMVAACGSSTTPDAAKGTIDAAHAGIDSAAGSPDASTKLNGCDPATAEDHTGVASFTITFGPGFTYSPKCSKVTAGTAVTFMANSTTFGGHPLRAGTPGNEDTGSPIKATNTGTASAAFTLPAGSYGFWCAFHGSGGMNGAVFAK